MLGGLTKTMTKHECVDSDARILLIRVLPSPRPPHPLRPLITALFRRIQALHPSNTRQNLILLLEHLQRKPRPCMPRNMAMDQPNSRIIRLEREDEVAVVGQHGNVAAGWVVEGELGRVGGVEVLTSLRDYGEVVAVEVDGVGA